MSDFILETYSKLAGISAILGFLAIAHGYNRKNHVKNLLKNGIKTEGKVVEIYPNPGPLFGKGAAIGSAPVVEYTTQSGNILKHTSTTYREPCPYQIGQIVNIWYINYKSRREAALEDDQVGNLPKQLITAGLILMAFSLPRIISMLFAFEVAG